MPTVVPVIAFTCWTKTSELVEPVGLANMAQKSRPWLSKAIEESPPNPPKFAGRFALTVMGNVTPPSVEMRSDRNSATTTLFVFVGLTAMVGSLPPCNGMSALATNASAVDSSTSGDSCAERQLVTEFVPLLHPITAPPKISGGRT